MKTKEQLKNNYIMRQKFIKSIIGLLVFISICSCGGTERYNDYDEKELHTGQSRFIVLRNTKDFSSFEIIVDKETRVQYLLFVEGYKAGLTPLLDEKGNISLYQGEIK